MHDSVVFRIGAGWNKFREVFGIRCGGGLSQRIKGIVYQISARSATRCEAESWPMRGAVINRLYTTEIRMIQRCLEKL